MAIIYTYGFDDNVQDNDAWIGTNATNRKTKQFTVASVANYLNNAGRIAVGGQMTFKFVTSGATNGTISFPGGGGDGTNFTDIASLYVSIIDTSGANVTEWLNYLVGQELLLSEQNEPNNFGHYRITSYTVDTNPNFYTLVLTDIGGYGTITADTYYNLNNINLITGTTDPTGLEAINEGNGIGWRLIGRDADNYGNIGLNAIDFSNSTSVSTEKGSVGEATITFGYNNINQSGQSIVTGSGVSLKKTNEFSASNIVTGESPLNIWGVTYNSLIAAWRSEVNVEGTSYDTNVVYQSLIVGDGLNFYAGRDSGVVGGGLISGSTGCFTVGVGNEDLTTTTSTYITNYYNNYGPRFIVGCGTYQPSNGAITRQNGFVVMSDGTARFPILTNNMIDAANDDSAVTKGWVNSGPALTSEQVRIEVKNTSGVTLVKGTPVYITGTVGATIRAEIAAADATSSATMPAVGLLLQDLINNEEGFAVTGGFLTNITTDPIDGITPTENDTVYVKAGGGLTLTKPTGSNLIQNIAKVGKVSGGNAGSLVVSSILRTNDVPNLTTGKIWVGTAANTAESGVVYLDEGNGRMGIGTTSPLNLLHVAGDARLDGDLVFTGTGFINNNVGNLQLETVGAKDIYLSPATGGDVIVNSGNVGIGTTSPIVPLHVIGDTVIEDTSAVLTLKSTQAGATSSIQFESLANAGIVGGGSADYLSFLTASNHRMRINSSGNVGIGTTSPAYKLDIQAESPAVRIRDISDANSFLVGADNSGGYLGMFTNDSLRVYTNSLERIRVDSSGNVGIGTTSPAYPLHVDGAAYAVSGLFGALGGDRIQISNRANNDVAVESFSAELFLSSGFNGISFEGSANTTLMKLTDTGELGIGTTSPAAKLDVNGDSSYSSDYNFLSISGTKTGGTAVTNVKGIDLSIGSGDIVAGNDITNLYGAYINNNTSGGSASVIGNWYGVYVPSADADRVSNRVSAYFGDNVGIGDTAPTSKLSVLASLNTYAAQYIRNAGTGAVLELNQQGTGNIFEAFDNSSSVFVIKDGGNVGIGTTSPDYLLDVAGSARIQASLNFAGTGASDSTWKIEPNNANADLQINEIGVGSRMYFKSGGNVGIGTTSPATKLDVNGDINISTISNSYKINNITTLDHSTTYTRLYNPEGAIGLYVGDSADRSNYYDNDFHKFRTAGGSTALMYLNTTGLGIGTTNPTTKLDVVASATTSTDIAHFANSNQVAKIKLLLDSLGSSQISMLDGDNNEDVRLSARSNSWINEGNVGIGTTSPASKLNINGGTGSLSTGLTFGDGDTGIWESSDDILRFSTAASTRMVINSSGNVGIGTTSPIYDLDVTGDIRATSEIFWGDNSGPVGRMYSGGQTGVILNTADTGIIQLSGGNLTSSGGNIGLYGGTHATLPNIINFRNGGADAMRIVANGNVGVGTTSPNHKLHVSGNALVTNLYLGTNIIHDGDTNTSIGFDTDTIKLTTSGVERLRIDSNGNVGIGTTTPVATLDVNGSIKVGGSLLAPAANTVGAMRYRSDSNNSYVEMIMQTGASTYAWVTIKQNTW